MLRQKHTYSLQEFFLDTVWHQGCKNKIASQTISFLIDQQTIFKGCSHLCDFNKGDLCNLQRIQQ